MAMSQTEEPLFAEQFQSITANIGRAIMGKPDVLDLAVTCLLAEGHLLIEDAPGVGKTSLAKALAITVQAEFGRIQFTPDLLPSDVVRGHHLEPGPPTRWTSSPGRCSPASWWPTRSTGPPRRPSRRCWRRWPRARSPSMEPPMAFPGRSW